MLINALPWAVRRLGISRKGKCSGNNLLKQNGYNLVANMFSQFFTRTAIAISALATITIGLHGERSDGKTILSNSVTSKTNQCLDTPTKWGIMAFPGVDLIDVYGPMEILYFVAANRYLNVKIITPTDSNIVIDVPMGNKFNSTYSPEIVSAASFEDDLDLDVLLVPGGAAARDTSLTYVDDYIARMFPKIKYFVTVCTGAIFAARAGVLDGRRATTNKNAWDLVTAQGNNITWVAPARFVIDGNVWTSSGVS